MKTETKGVAAPVGDTAQHRTGSTDGDIKERLRAIFEDRTLVPLGCVHLVGLDHIQEQIGPARWSVIQERVHQFVQKILQQRLGPKDVWFRHGDDKYVLIFSHLEKKTAQLVCGNILKQLNESLLGQAETSGIDVQTAVIEIDGSIKFESIHLKDLLDAALTQAAPAAIAGTAPSAAREQEAAGHRPVESLTAHDERLGVLRSALHGESTHKTALFVFRPVWDAANQVLSTYMCIPAYSRNQYSNFSEYGNFINQSDAEAIFEVDCDRAVRAMIMAARSYGSGIKYFSSVSVHFESLAGVKRRREYLQLLNLMPPHLVPFFGFAIQGLPPGIPLGRLIELVTALRPYSRRVIAHCGVEERDHGTFSQAGIKLVSTPTPQHVPDGEAIEKVRGFALFAKRHGLHVHAGGVRGESMMRSFLQAGVTFLSGPVLGGDIDQPEQMQRLCEPDILAGSRARVHLQH